MANGERFAFEDPWKDPESLFPEFMTELRLRYPTYGLVYDRRREQWVCYQLGTEGDLKIVAYVESGDGVAMDPCMEFLDKLSMSDVIRQHGSVRAYLDWLEREEQRRYDEGMASLDEDLQYAAKPIRDWIAKGGAETIVLRPLPEEHRRQVEADLNLSASAQPTRFQEAS